jgi:hypothetical protein
VTRLDLASDEELSRFARLYGGTVQRLVSSGLQFFDRAVRHRVAGFDDLSNQEKDALVYRKAAGYTELVASIVPWLPAAAPRTLGPRICRLCHRAIHGAARDQTVAAQAAAGDRVS